MQPGRALYALRKHTVEPVFGIIKHVMGLGQFSRESIEIPPHLLLPPFDHSALYIS
ncbi:hypothetical protein L861_23055 [Litchfieldella anticariensis FP35 = DSM 16096]|uniref:Transposase DDE domain-containing protein n=1 Tax=Litchfieldella anticariensis (strain DSM 16096 / CECT 5854 / CIP 108499 / LMG 22089 / FP35) TaxID=1121939 RepID=S2LEL2_LITA3|nr:hypothetical protein L861_23055 [Halomonas anticariensis FP35 = DSM 16096]